MSKNKFKDLANEDIEYIASVYMSDVTHNEKIDILTKKYGVVGRTIRKWWKNLNLSRYSDNIPSQLVAARDRILGEYDILLVTAAQNKTSINRSFVHNMEAYKDFLTKMGYRVEILVIPSRYRNPTSIAAAIKAGENWWDSHIEEYLIYDKIDFCDTLIDGTLRINPTTSTPLRGYEAIAGGSNLIIGHPRIHLEVLPRMPSYPLRMMASTGYCTHKNYSESGVGAKGFIHHSYGFIILESIDDVCLPPRSVSAKDDGSFVDIIYDVKDKVVTIAEGCESIILGDIHAAVVDPKKMDATKELIEIIKPSSVVMHDMYDGSTINPHEKKDLYIRKKKIRDGVSSISKEEEITYDVIEGVINMHDFESIYIIQSNHDDFLDRFINEFNWKTDLHNSETYLRYAQIQQTQNLEAYGGIFGYLVTERFGGKVTYIPYGTSLRVLDIELGLHGQSGVSGARGSKTTFKKLNMKTIQGHTHTPFIMDSVYCVGTSTGLNQYYTRKGLNKVAHADVILHKTGKRQLVVYGSDYKISNLINKNN